MMTLQQANLEEVLLHLRHAHASMRRLMSVSDDWVARERVEIEFRELRDMIGEFARYQLGLAPPSRVRSGR